MPSNNLTLFSLSLLLFMSACSKSETDKDSTLQNKVADRSSPTLTILEEAKVADLIGKKGKYETSGVVSLGDKYYAVFDNIPEILELRRPLSEKKHLLKANSYPAEGFEGIAFNTKQQQFYLLEEALPQQNDYFAKLSHYDQDFKFETSQWLKPKKAFKDDSKGFEGLTYLHHNNQDYLLALCEGNQCKSGKKGKKTGHGRIQIFQQENGVWHYQETLELPKSLHFTDYAGMDLQGEQIAIVSQENAQLWLGTLNIAKKTKQWDIKDEGKRYDFPRDKQGEILYCNVEGVAWLDKTTLITVTDKIKKGKQDKRCAAKDQSVQIIQVPQK